MFHQWTLPCPSLDADITPIMADLRLIYHLRTNNQAMTYSNFLPSIHSGSAIDENADAFTRLCAALESVAKEVSQDAISLLEIDDRFLGNTYTIITGHSKKPTSRYLRCRLFVSLVIQ